MLLMVEQGRIEAGSKVRVINPRSLHYGRTGHVEVLASYVGSAGGPFSGPPESRGWRILFDWPLGGMGFRAVLRENEFEVIPKL